MHIVVVANGELRSDAQPTLTAMLAEADMVIAADGGLCHCRELGQWPDLLVGDLDSAPADLVEAARAKGTEVRRHPSDKDATDLELALADARDAGAESVTVVAAFGGRLDHEVATIGLLTSQQWESVAMAASDGVRSLWVIRASVELELSRGANVSLVPWGGDVTGVTTQGLKWPLRDEDLPMGTTRGVSNVAVAQRQQVSIIGGVLLAITDT